MTRKKRPARKKPVLAPRRAVAPSRKAAGTTAPAAGTAPRRPADGASRTLALAAIEAALDKKALLPVLLDVSALASYTDFIAIVSGRSDRQVDAVAEHVEEALRQKGRRPVGVEGRGSGRWTLLDFGDVVVHVFHHPVREFYDLEGLWIDAPRVKLDVPPEARPDEADAFYGSF